MTNDKKPDIWEWGYRLDLIQDLYALFKHGKTWVLPAAIAIGSAVLRYRDHVSAAQVFLYGIWGFAGGLVIVAVYAFRHSRLGGGQPSGAQADQLHRVDNDVTGIINIYLNRDARNERFHALMRGATTVWVATHQATSLRANRQWWDKIERLILPEQNGFATDLLARVIEETTLTTINNDIASAVSDAGRRLEVKQLDAFFNSIVIGDPNSGNAWVSIEIYLPWWSARNRPSIVLTENEHSAAVKNVIMAYENLWKLQPKPNQRAIARENEMKLLRTDLEVERREVALLRLEKLTKSFKEQRMNAQPSVRGGANGQLSTSRYRTGLLFLRALRCARAPRYGPNHAGCQFEGGSRNGKHFATEISGSNRSFVAVCGAPARPRGFLETKPGNRKGGP